MIRKVLLATVAAMVVLALNTTAKADSFTLAQGQTLTFNFSSTQYPGATATATVTLQGNQLILNVTNTSTDGTTRLKGIGINTTPDLQVSSSSFSGGLSNFQFSTGGGGLGNMEAISSSAGNRTLNQGVSNTGTAIFTLSSAPTSITIDQITVHLISLPNGESIKLNGNGNAPIPEPMTMLLFGTGLAGVAARARRRRKAKV